MQNLAYADRSNNIYLQNGLVTHSHLKYALLRGFIDHLNELKKQQVLIRTFQAQEVREISGIRRRSAFSRQQLHVYSVDVL